MKSLHSWLWRSQRASSVEVRLRFNLLANSQSVATGRIREQAPSFACTFSTDSSSDNRARLSRIWAPTGGITATVDEDAHSKLIRGGFLRQAHSGIFHLLPLGQRLQKKIERLVDRHMSCLGASKVELSSISSEELWARSGRLSKVNSELFRFKDRRLSNYLLSPTHEEEITSLVAGAVKSYKELPVRLYQISRKYRDELRPRHGLLRSREFVMKDLYTFDLSIDLALATYHRVRKAYAVLFDELKIPYLVAEADSGSMGGDLSHEFHFPTPLGEDQVISCNTCSYVANEELAQSSGPRDLPSQSDAGWLYIEPSEQTPLAGNSAFTVWRGVSQDRTKLINVWYAVAGGGEVNTHAVKAVIPDLDPGIKDALTMWAKSTGNAERLSMKTVINLIDYRLPMSVSTHVQSLDSGLPFVRSSLVEDTISIMTEDPSTGQPLNLLRITDGDTCPRCTNGKLMVQKAIELGHTFFLGTRYSVPLQATVEVPPNYLSTDDLALAKRGRGATGGTLPATVEVPMQMGCHGIGVSRMIGAVAEALVDDRGLNWPRIIAPFEAVVVPLKGLEIDALQVYDVLVEAGRCSGDNEVMDVILDDREHPFAWKLQDADLLGYPVLVVVGRTWKQSGTCEVQCRRLGIRQQVPLTELRAFVSGLLVQL